MKLCLNEWMLVTGILKWIQMVWFVLQPEFKNQDLHVKITWGLEMLPTKTMIRACHWQKNLSDEGTSQLCWCQHKNGFWFWKDTWVNMWQEESLRENCSYSELFWPVFSRVWTEYEKMRTRITWNTEVFYTVNMCNQVLSQCKNPI